jgi:inner membrane protein
MDSITHALLGAVTAQLGFRQKIGRDATWLAALSALTPDLDVLVVPLLSLTGTETDDLAQLTTHRGLSHSLLMVPLMALPLAAGWWYFRRRINNRHNHDQDVAGDGSISQQPVKPRQSPFSLLYLCLLTAMMAHPLLDLVTTYGTQLFLPFTHRRFAIDAVPIVDIIYTPILILTLLACYLVRRLSPRPAIRSTLVIGWAGFLFSCAYIAAGWGMHNLAISRAMAVASGQERHVTSANAYPALGTIFLWRTVLRTDDGWGVARVHLFSRSLPTIRYAPQADNEWVRRAERLEEVKVFDWFARSQLRADYSRQDGRHVVEFDDMRYAPTADSLESLWSLRATFDSPGQPPRVERVRHYHGGRFSRMVGQSWHDIWNP